MTLKFRIDYKSFIEFYLEAFYKTESFNKKIKCIYVYIFCFVTFILLVSKESKVRLSMLIIGILLFIFIKSIVKSIYRNIETIKLRKKEFLYMFKDMEVTIYEEQGIYINNFREKNLIGFKAVNSINILDNYIIVIFINDEYLYIPKTAFKNTEEEYDFIDLLKDKTNKTVSRQYPQVLLYK